MSHERERIYAVFVNTCTHVLLLWELLDLNQGKGNTTNLNISFSTENEKRAAQLIICPFTIIILVQ